MTISELKVGYMVTKKWSSYQNHMSRLKNGLLFLNHRFFPCFTLLVQ